MKNTLARVIRLTLAWTVLIAGMAVSAAILRWVVHTGLWLALLPSLALGALATWGCLYRYASHRLALARWRSSLTTCPRCHRQVPEWFIEWVPMGGIFYNEGEGSEEGICYRCTQYYPRPVECETEDDWCARFEALRRRGRQQPPEDGDAELIARGHDESLPIRLRPNLMHTSLRECSNVQSPRGPRLAPSLSPLSFWRLAPSAFCTSRVRACG